MGSPKRAMPSADRRAIPSSADAGIPAAAAPAPRPAMVGGHREPLVLPRRAAARKSTPPPMSRYARRPWARARDGLHDRRPRPSAGGVVDARAALPPLGGGDRRRGCVHDPPRARRSGPGTPRAPHPFKGTRLVAPRARRPPETPPDRGAARTMERVPPPVATCRTSSGRAARDSASMLAPRTFPVSQVDRAWPRSEVAAVMTLGSPRKW